MKKLFYMIQSFFGKLLSLLGKKGLHITVDLDDEGHPNLDITVHLCEKEQNKEGGH